MNSVSTLRHQRIEARLWASVMIKTHWLSVKGQEESSSRDLTESFGFVPIYTLLGSDMVLFICLRFHAFSSIQHCKGTPPTFLLCHFIYLFSCQIILVLALVLVLLPEVQPADKSVCSYLKIVTADNSYSLTRASQKVNLRRKRGCEQSFGIRYDLRRWIWLMYGARMIARQCITVSGVKTLLLLLITIMANGGKWGVDTLGSESFPTCLPLRLASRGPCEVLSYLLD